MSQKRTRGHVKVQTDGMRDHPMYHQWRGMISRCHSPTNTNYLNYGGRGIEVCPQWFSFLAYLKDVGERPTGKSLDRINNNGDYEPGNVRWASGTQQAYNKRQGSSNILPVPIHEIVWACHHYKQSLA